MRIWLDDERDPKKKFTQDNCGAIGDEIWIKSPDDLIELLRKGNVTYISFDHDLGHTKTGYDVAFFIEKMAANGRINRISWRIHSYNAIGKQAIFRAMKRADQFWSNIEKNDGK